jgi:hypothetical protein
MSGKKRFETLSRALGVRLARRQAGRIVRSTVALASLAAADIRSTEARRKKRKKHKHKKRKGGKPQQECITPCTASNCAFIPDSCPLFPANNIWNARVDGLDADDNSAAYVDAIGRATGLHADFGAGHYEGGPIGIPFVVVTGAQPPVPLQLGAYGDESDPGPYPVPEDAPIEGGCERGGDRHVLVVESDSCVLYELFHATPLANGGWRADSAARFDLTANDLRPAGWTSADAAGLPILPGLVRYEEILAGEINHALRFTAEPTRDAYVWPARHEAGSTIDPNLPPMGQRFRLKAGFDISGFSPTNQIILNALQEYGMILADNGGDWFLSGAPDERWDNDDLHELGAVTGDAFEAVDCTPLMVDEDSGEVTD